MKCSKCSESAIHDSPKLCKNHFIEYFEEKTKDTIKKYNLIKKSDKICVAASGGKDSVALLYVLKKFGYNIEALALDEGIAGYRDKSLEFLENFCKEHNIPLRVFSYEKEIGSTVDKLSKKYSPACNVCGTFRRHLLDKHAKGYDKIATGHNLDDEAQAVLMNILKAHTQIFSRQGPITRKVKGFVQKIKPFYFTKEKEVMVYAFLLKLNVDFEECPYAPLSFRAHVRDLLNKYESENAGAKLNIVNKYLDMKKDISDDAPLDQCTVCGAPSSGSICKACRFREEIKIDNK